MMRKPTIFVLVCLSLAALGCGDELGSVSVSVDVSQGTAPLLVAFECSAAGEPVTYEWSFGDGATATNPNASHTYTEAGVFQARCAAHNEGSVAFSEPVQITVHEGGTPVVDVAAQPTGGQAPLEVSFVATPMSGDEPLAYLWDFDDGTTDDESGAEVTHIFDAGGQYDVRLQVTDADEEVGTTVIAIEVLVPDEAPSVTAGVLAGECTVPAVTGAVLEVDVTDPDDDVFTYEWVFVEVPENSAAFFNDPSVPDPSLFPDVTGTYRVRVVVSDGRHRVASDPITVVADAVPAAIEILTGDEQSDEPRAEADERLRVHVTNGCGAPIPGVRVDWYGENAWPAPQSSLTNTLGAARTRLTFGTRAGESVVRATAGPVSVEIRSTVLAGEPRYLLLEEVGAAPVSDVDGVEIAFQVVDEWFNPVIPEEEVTFDLRLDDGSEDEPIVELDSSGSGRSQRLNIETRDGRRTQEIYSTDLVTASIIVDNISDDSLQAVALERMFADGFEGASNWTLDGGPAQWSVGVPAFGPEGAWAGDNVLATTLDGPYRADEWLTGSRANRRIVLSHPAGITSTIVRFRHWYDFGIGEDGCTVGAGFIFVGNSAVAPLGNYPGPVSCQEPDNAFGFGGRSAGWVETATNVTGRTVDLSFVVLADDRNGELETGAGWYVDGLELVAVTPRARVTFEPGPAARVDASTIWNGGSGDCQYPGRVRIEVFDAFDNPVLEGVSVALSLTSDATFDALVRGQRLEADGSEATVETGPGGIIELDVLHDGAGTVTLTATLPDASDDATAPVSFPASPSSEVGYCDDGADNDCDGAVSCDDEDCWDHVGCDEANACTDGRDNDENGLTDCEDPVCADHEAGTCDSGVAFLFANGLCELSSQLSVAGCLCANDTGCDDIVSNLGPYGIHANICHRAAGPALESVPDSLGVCAPSCFLGGLLGDVCPTVVPGSVCNPDGRCVLGEEGE